LHEAATSPPVVFPKAVREAAVSLTADLVNELLTAKPSPVEAVKLNRV
jgi:hypothetical protein